MTNKRRIAAGAIFMTGLTGPPFEAGAGNALTTPDAMRVIIATESNQLYQWSRGASVPDWTIGLNGQSWGAQSPIAEVAFLGDHILVIERSGNILRVSAQGDILSEATPIYGYIRLSVEISEVEGPLVDEPVDALARTSSAFFDTETDSLYLAPDVGEVVKVPVDVVLVDGAASLTNALLFQFKDRNLTMWQRISDDPALEFPRWPITEAVVTALAVCQDVVVAGTDDGKVVFVNETDHLQEHIRIRQVGDLSAPVKSMIDVGCLGDSFAYSVGFDTGNGQIQIWSLETRSAVSWAGLGSSGHPGMAFVAAASTSGDFLATLGDGDIRVWSVQEGQIDLVAAHSLGRMKQLFAIAPIGIDDFIFWDGAAVWNLPSSGEAPSLYAGSPERSPSKFR